MHDSKENPPNLYVAYVADKSSDKVIKLIYDSVGKIQKQIKWIERNGFKNAKNIHFNEGNSRDL